MEIIDFSILIGILLLCILTFQETLLCRKHNESVENYLDKIDDRLIKNHELHMGNYALLKKLLQEDCAEVRGYVKDCEKCITTLTQIMKAIEESKKKSKPKKIKRKAKNV